ncbi:hypothetical protein L0Z33_29610 [Burkholderia multivorans]|uniref:hypothetical protein n=1 Tax=Burkholderia multivorans TaxID=87883 RepID=UPI00207C981B|nr:hypothetical protein [Burkholderia multivorans]MCO1417112.1 hypothetical protein [Burkholderia multivorans]
MVTIWLSAAHKSIARTAFNRAVDERVVRRFPNHALAKSSRDRLENAAKSTSKLLKHTEIRREISLQTRAEINVSTVEEYKEALQGGAKFPPVVTFFDGIYYYLADGWHRTRRMSLRASRKFRPMFIRARGGRTTLCPWRKCDSWSASHERGQRRAVSMMLEDAEWAAWSDHEIARACKVSQPFVGKLAQLSPITLSVTMHLVHPLRCFVHRLRTANRESIQQGMAPKQ